MITIDSAYEIASAVAMVPSPTPYDSPFKQNTARLAYYSAI